MAARYVALQSAAAGAAGGELAAADGGADMSFKWDRECEEALHTVVLNHIAAGTGCVSARLAAHAVSTVCVLTPVEPLTANTSLLSRRWCRSTSGRQARWTKKH